MTQESKQKGIDKGESVPLVEQVLEKIAKIYYENAIKFDNTMTLERAKFYVKDLLNHSIITSIDFKGLELISLTESLVREENEKEIKSLKSAFNELLEDNSKMHDRLKKYEEWTGRKL